MHARPGTVLLALPRGLLADVIELALRREGIHPVRPDLSSPARVWDVAIIPASPWRIVRARRLVVIRDDDPASAFDAAIDAVRGAIRVGGC